MAASSHTLPLRAQKTLRLRLAKRKVPSLPLLYLPPLYPRYVHPCYMYPPFKCLSPISPPFIFVFLYVSSSSMPPFTPPPQYALFSLSLLLSPSIKVLYPPSLCASSYVPPPPSPSATMAVGTALIPLNESTLTLLICTFLFPPLSQCYDGRRH